MIRWCLLLWKAGICKDLFTVLGHGFSVRFTVRVLQGMFVTLRKPGWKLVELEFVDVPSFAAILVIIHFNHISFDIYRNTSSICGTTFLRRSAPLPWLHLPGPSSFKVWNDSNVSARLCSFACYGVLLSWWEKGSSSSLVTDVWPLALALKWFDPLSSRTPRSVLYVTDLA